MVIVLVVLVAVGGGAFLLAGDDDGDSGGGDLSSGPAADVADCVHPKPDGSCPSPGEAPSADAAGGAESPEAQAYVDALAEVNESTSRGVFSGDDARCMAEAMVDALGLAALHATSPDEIRANPTSTLADLGVQGDQAQIDQLADATAGCIDIPELFKTILEQQGASGETVDCVEEHMDTHVVAASIVADFAGSEEVREDARTAADDLLGPCEVPAG